MAESYNRVLKKPPGYRDPSLPVHTAPRPPARKPVIPPSFPMVRKRRRRWCRLCCCFVCILVFVLALLLLVAGAIFYLLFDPKLPVFHLRAVQFPRFSVTSSPDGVTFVETKAVVAVEAVNPNHKITILYGRSDLEVTEPEGGTVLGSASREEFTQGGRNVTVLRFGMAQARVPVEGDVGARLKGRYRSGALVVSVEARTRLGLAVGRWRTGTVRVRVVCGGVNLKKVEGGGATPRCTLNLLRWINIH